MTIQLYELAAAEDDHVFSPYCWRIRLALAHKGLPFESLPWRMTEKEKISFSGSELVPVLVDGDTVVTESWDILAYLEERYPEAPLGLTQGEARFVRYWTELVLHPGLSRMIVFDVFETVHPKDQGYFRETRERRFGQPLEAFSAETDRKLQEFRNAMAPLRKTLEAQPFLGGDTPNVSDYVVFSGLMWARCTSPLVVLEEADPIHAWREKLLDAFDGMARKAPFREGKI